MVRTSCILFIVLFDDRTFSFKNSRVDIKQCLQQFNPLPLKFSQNLKHSPSVHDLIYLLELCCHRCINYYCEKPKICFKHSIRYQLVLFIKTEVTGVILNLDNALFTK